MFPRPTRRQWFGGLFGALLAALGWRPRKAEAALGSGPFVRPDGAPTPGPSAGSLVGPGHPGGECFIVGKTSSFDFALAGSPAPLKVTTRPWKYVTTTYDRAGRIVARQEAWGTLTVTHLEHGVCCSFAPTPPPAGPSPPTAQPRPPA
jgi:YD repeat-containing protein